MFLNHLESLLSLAFYCHEDEDDDNSDDGDGGSNPYRLWNMVNVLC